MPGLLALAALLTVATSAGPTAPVFVDASLATGANDGSSWSDAFRGPLGLQAALASVPAASSAEIWVADGVYRPAAPGGSTAAHFALRDLVAIYGGFAGGESARDERDPATNIAILSGDVNGDDVIGANHMWVNTSDNARHVVRGFEVGPSALIDGVTIRRGSAEESATADDETGGNIELVHASPTITRCIMRDGFADEGGGGVSIDAGAPTFIDCVFTANRTWNLGGGAMTRNAATPLFWRCAFVENVASMGSGAFFGAPGPGWTPGRPVHTTIRACDFVRNGNPDGEGPGVSAGAGIFAFEGSLTIETSSFVDNRTVAGGGGVFVQGASATIIASDFVGNEGQGDGGGAFYVNGNEEGTATTHFIDCRFTGNNGVGVSIFVGVLEMTNCTMVANNLHAPFHWPVIATQAPSTAHLRNCVVRDHVPILKPGLAGNFISIIAPGITIDRSCVEDWDGSLPGAGNFDADPMFVDALGADGIAGTVDDDLRLRAGSPCIDASDHAFRTLRSNDDVDGLPRFVDDVGTIDASPSRAPVADLGAHEFQGTTCAADLDGDGLVGGADLALMLGAWGSAGTGDLDGSGAVDAADLALLLGAWGACR